MANRPQHEPVTTPDGSGSGVTPAPELSVLMVNYNTWRECAEALQSLQRHPPARADGSAMPYEVVVVDNCSPIADRTARRRVERLLEDIRNRWNDPAAGVLVLHPENAGYSVGVNTAFRHSRGRWILVSNPDLIYPPGCIDALLRHMERNPGTGCAVPKGFWGEDQKARLPPNILPTIGDLLSATLGEFFPSVSRRRSLRKAEIARAVWEAEEPMALPMMSGCLFLMDRRFFVQIGLMDERFPLYYEDADLSVRIRRAGRRVVQVPDAHIIHWVNRSGQTEMETVWKRHDISRRLYYRKWYGLPGYWLLRFCEGVVGSRLGRKLRRSAPHGPYVDLGAPAGPPVLELPRHCDRFLIQVSLDARFYLSGGVFGSGDRWTPSDSMYRNFSPTTYYCRAFDLSDGRMEPLRMWRYVHVMPAKVPAATAVAEGRDA